MIFTHTMQVFISYSQADQKWADALKSGLTAEGFEVSDPVGDVCAGENFYLEAGKALARADAMLVVLSPQSAASRSVRAEIEYALSSPQFRDRLISLLVAPTEDIPWILRKQPFIRARKNFRETIQQIADALHKSPATVA